MFADAAELRSGHLEGPHRRPGGEAPAWLVWHLRSVLLWGPRLETDQAETLPGAPRKPRPPREMALAEGQAPSGPGSRADRGGDPGLRQDNPSLRAPGKSSQRPVAQLGALPPVSLSVAWEGAGLQPAQGLLAGRGHRPGKARSRVSPGGRSSVALGPLWGSSETIPEPTSSSRKPSRAAPACLSFSVSHFAGCGAWTA